MRVQGLNIALRPRPSWEAVDLGVALVRRHARPIFATWAIVTGVAFVLLHALLLPFDLAWLAGLLLWWLKPAFDRVPLFVLSRAIMGQTPGVRETLRAMRGGWGPLLPWLLWRRLHPLRSMLLPVDLLEGAHGANRGARVRVLSSGEGSTPLLLTVIGLHLEVMLWGSVIVFGLMLVPTEFLSDSLESMYQTLVEQPPWWLDTLGNAMYWLAMCVIEPFYVGAGFALYLNRRTLLEAWDVELAFRRLAARLARSAVLLLALGAIAWPTARATADEFKPVASGSVEEKRDASKPWERVSSDADAAPGKAFREPEEMFDVQADDEIAQDASPRVARDRDDDADEEAEEDDEDRDAEIAAAPVTRLDALFDADAIRADPDFDRALQQALADPDLAPKQQVGQWRLRDPLRDEEEKTSTPGWARSLSAALALLVENFGWILLAIALGLLVLHGRRWLPWLLGAAAARAAAEAPAAIREQALDAPPPADLPAAVLALWQAGDARAALSLFYRGALAALVERLGVALPPGATEEESLRYARRLASQPFAPLFRRVVQRWQAMAYAHRAPSEAELQELLDAWRALETPA